MIGEEMSRPCPPTPTCPSLPTEVWITIFSYHQDLVHLWNDCRCVSSTLRACAEYAFAEYFLEEIHIEFELDKHNLGGKSKRPSIPVHFDKIGKHQEMAWFRDERARSEICAGMKRNDQVHYDKVMNRWEENVNHTRPEMPNYTISLRGLVNDTALPRLQIDINSRTIGFEWRRALNLFYREQRQYQTLKKEWQECTAKKIRENNGRLARGEKLMPSDYPQPWHSAEAEVRKQVRRARLKEAYKDDERMLWAIESLQHFEQYGAASGSTKAFKLNPDLPGAGLGEKWFGYMYLVQELYLDEWSCMHRIDTKAESYVGSM